MAGKLQRLTWIEVKQQAIARPQQQRPACLPYVSDTPLAAIGLDASRPANELALGCRIADLRPFTTFAVV